MSPFMIPIAALCIPIIAIICGTIVALSKRHTPESSPEETEMIQEIHQALSRMEQRVEALETILFDQHRKEG